MTKIFSFSAGLILIIAGSGKIISAMGHVAILNRDDPVFSIQFGHLMVVVGLLELLIGSICFFCKWQVVGYVATAWLVTCILVYRIGLMWIGWHQPCQCLGNFADALHISSQTADTIMKIILAYLLIGSYGSLFWLWQQRNKAESAAAVQ
jgi:hypothetical protein